MGWGFIKRAAKKVAKRAWKRRPSKRYLKAAKIIAKLTPGDEDDKFLNKVDKKVTSIEEKALELAARNSTKAFNKANKRS